MKRGLIIFLIGFLVILFLIGGFYFFVFKTIKNLEIEKEFFCGDDTPFEECSLDKPYYCDEGILVVNVELCGCPEILEEKNNSCISEYFKENLSFDLGIFDFVLYKGVLNHLSNLSRSIEYKEEEIPKRSDFKFKKINDDLQREALMSLIKDIQNLAPNSKNLQAKIAVDFVQNIPYEEADFVKVFKGNYEIRAARYPYQVIYESVGSCEGKSELLVFLLRELGYKTSIFYYGSENHEAVGIGCPLKYSLNNTGYCFIETTVPSPISFSSGVYLNVGGDSKLSSVPEIFPISDGISLNYNLEDYKDAKNLEKLRNKVETKGKLNFFQKKRLEELRIKYGLNY